MEQQSVRTFQWIWTSPNGQQRFIVSCEKADEFLEAYELVKTLLPNAELVSANGTVLEEVPAPQPQGNGTAHLCLIHNKPMKLRRTKDGKKTWWDHRWQEGEDWYQCNGRETRVNSSNTAVS